MLASNLSYGSRNSEVTSLQQFLVSQNYPGGGSWMVTGYFGNATVQAVRNFQQSAGLPMTGAVDAATRSAIQSRTCGFPGLGYAQGSLSNYPYSYSYSTPTYTTPAYAPSYTPSYLPTGQAGTYPTYPTYPSTPWGMTPVINSLSVTSGGQGTVVTAYGANFDIYSTSVRFGVTSIVPARDTTQTQFKFTIPNVPSGSYPVSVTTSRGVSNSLSFNVTGSTNCGWGYLYPCAQINLSSLSPASGALGTSVTVYGNGFSTSGNTVFFGGVTIPNINSFNGNTLLFTVPYTVTGYGQQIVGGTYPVSVRNSQGQTSNTLNFSVTSGSGGGAPIVASVTGPTTLSTGTQGTWTLTLNAPYGSYVTTSVQWGDESLYAYAAGVPQSTYVSGQQTVTFTHTYNSSGNYTPTFTVTGPGGSNTASATVNVSTSGGGGTGSLYLNSINPSSARTGTYVTLQGSGFTATGNDVHFGVGGMKNVSSSGSTISFVIPSWVSPCDLIGGYLCGAPATQVVPGTYPVYVTNSTGATNIVNFTVTP